MITNSLVRDKVPDRIAAQGATPVVAKLKGEELQFAMRKRMSVSIAELASLGGKESVHALAEIQTLLNAYCKELGISATELSKAMGTQRHELGDFTQGYFMFFNSPSDLIDVVQSLSK